MRRDVSLYLSPLDHLVMSSLHAQRCFLARASIMSLSAVFSACAEMFLRLCSLPFRSVCLLCMRRDVSVGGRYYQKTH